MRENVFGYVIVHDDESPLCMLKKQQICYSLSCGFRDGTAGFGNGLISWEIAKVDESFSSDDFKKEMVAIYPVFTMQNIYLAQRLLKRKKLDNSLSDLEKEQLLAWLDEKTTTVPIVSIGTQGEMRSYLRVSFKSQDFYNKMTRKKLAYILNILNPYMAKPYGVKMAKGRQLKHIEHWLRLKNCI